MAGKNPVGSVKGSPIGGAFVVEVGGAFVLSNSAHDLGVAFVRGGPFAIEVSAVSAPSPVSP